MSILSSRSPQYASTKNKTVPNRVASVWSVESWTIHSSLGALNAKALDIFRHISKVCKYEKVCSLCGEKNLIIEIVLVRKIEQSRKNALLQKSWKITKS